MNDPKIDSYYLDNRYAIAVKKNPFLSSTSPNTYSGSHDYSFYPLLL